MSFEFIEVASHVGVTRITLNRPDRLNSFNEAMMLELAEAVKKVKDESDTRVLVITGAGRGFCAGADLAGSLPSGPGADIGIVLERHYNPLMLALRALPLPVVSIVNGVAAGAGASLALAADFTIAAHSAKFVLAFARIGLLPDAGATYFLPQRIGLARAMSLAMLGGEMKAEEAERVGLIHQAVPDAELKEASDLLIERLAKAPTAALAATKHALYSAYDQSLEEQLHLERQHQGRLGLTDDFREGVDAFREKRPARFLGR